MPSPFPGMNPYLENSQFWHDFHNRFIPHAAEILNEQIGSEYVVLLEEHVYVFDEDDDLPAMFGAVDVAIGQTNQAAAPAQKTRRISSPVRVLVPAAFQEREAYIEIRDRRKRDVITVIELLSPVNKKKGANRQQYVRKRELVMSSDTHFVEIDLLRGGPRMPFVNLPKCDYYALVSRVENRPANDLWPIQLREPLPKVPIPLKPGDNDIDLDLQHLVHRIYDRAGYAKIIYESEPEPKLRPADARWARQFLPKRRV